MPVTLPVPGTGFPAARVMQSFFPSASNILNVINCEGDRLFCNRNFLFCIKPLIARFMTFFMP